MNIESGLAYHIGQSIGRSSVSLLIAAAIVSVVLLIAAVWIAGLLLPGSDAIIAAPLRW
jgi:hypothetical protein